MKGPISVQNLIMDLWKRTTPELEERHGTLPLGTYKGGDTTIAWPGLLAAPASAIKRSVDAAMGGDSGYFFDDEGRVSDQLIRDSIDIAGGAMTGGLGVGLAGGLVDNAVGSAGGNLTQPQGIRAYRGVRDVSQRANAYFPPEATDDLAWWGSSNPDVANHYTKNAENSAVFPAEVRFKNPMELDLEGGHAGDVRYNGRRYVTEEMIPIARDLGHDGLIFKNVRDAARPQDVPLADTFAALRPGTVYSATTGDLLYANAPTGSSVPLAVNALEKTQPQNFKAQLEAQMSALQQAIDDGIVPKPDETVSTLRGAAAMAPASGAQGTFYRGVRSPDQPVAPSENAVWWASSSPRTASEYAPYDGSAVIPSEARFQNPLEIDAKGEFWSAIPFERDYKNTDQIANIARKRGHDGVVFRNVIDDISGTTTSDVIAALQRGTVYSPTTGDLLYANAPTGAAVPIGMEATDGEEIDLTSLLAEILGGGR